MIERNVDYLQMNVHIPERYLMRDGVIPVPCVRFYKRGYMDEIGVRYFYGNPKSEKALIVLSGQALEAARGRGMTDLDIIERYIRMGARCTRLDIAVTDYIEDDFVSVDDVKSWVKEGQVSSKWLGSGCLSLSKLKDDNNEQLETFYVGSPSERGKKGIFRAYDKGVQSGLSPAIITRLEVEIRGDSATYSAAKLAEGVHATGIFRSKFDCTNPQFERLMESPAHVPVRGKGQGKQEVEDKMAKRWDWLTEQVAPALHEAVEYDRKNGMGEDRLMKFLTEAGLMKEIRAYAENLANHKYRDKLFSNDMLPDE